MTAKKAKSFDQGLPSGDPVSPGRYDGLNVLSGQILRMSNSGLSRTYFLRKTLRLILTYFDADEINVLLRIYTDSTRFELIKYNRDVFRYNFFPPPNQTDSHEYATALEDHWNYILAGHTDISIPFATRGGGLLIRLPDEQTLRHELFRRTGLDKYLKRGGFQCLFISPFQLDKEKMGLLELASRNKTFQPDIDPDLIEGFINTLCITLLNQHTQAALQERVKELSCLYGMSRIAETPYVSLEDLMYSIMELIPPAWQYPDITQTRIVLDGIEYSHSGFESNESKLVSDIMINNRKRGEIEIVYTRKRPELDEGPFLKEERKLIDTMASELALIISRRESEEDMNKLQNQLHHADRLATVGELAAGVAHEINEPLGSILGFAQLASKYPGIPDQVKKDLDKIVKSSLHAREIVQKMMLFSRQVSAEKKQVNLNQIIEDSLYFYQSRCEKAGIKLQLTLQQDLPSMMADPVHLNQVVLNLVVNAIQAMPDGGILQIRTRSSVDKINLIIKDTGIGMTKEIREQIFHPFFSTKEAGQGLGLGLSVVEGIITTYLGSISVKSIPGKGTEFKIAFPVDRTIANPKDGKQGH
jgi:signal transduction histidine kinase